MLTDLTYYFYLTAMELRMMKKTSLLTLITSLTCSAFAYAGDMGEDPSMCCVTTFFSLEAGYTKTNIEGFNIDLIGVGTLAPVNSKKGYTARLAAGVLDKLYDEWGISGELGWGYYGRTSNNSSLLSTDFYLANSYTVSGFDLLVGVSYMQPSFDLFLKAGALVQTLSVSTTLEVASFDGAAFSSLATQSNKTGVLPEVKIGGAYNFNDNWSLTAAYAYAFGSTLKFTGTLDTLGNLTNVAINNQNPTLSTILVGIQYTV